mmetsp:Transcript_34803/g.41977  ORF Transcript_34803/g.41977 Transcript_34803/m.41977 type:complete len:243 (-) Transcript_34803:218-946(-)
MDSRNDRRETTGRTLDTVFNTNTNENPQHETCANGHVCYNYGRCISNGDNGYRCDCGGAQKASGGRSYTATYAGPSCEHAATSYCEYGVTISAISFCTNGGECRDQIVEGQKHPGCDCVDGYEGPHCEFDYGLAPQRPATPVSATKSTDSLPEGTIMTATSIFIISTAVVCLLISSTFFIRTILRQRRNTKRMLPTDVLPAEAMALEADGDTLKGLVAQLEDEKDDDQIELMETTEEHQQLV